MDGIYLREVDSLPQDSLTLAHYEELLPGQVQVVGGELPALQSWVLPHAEDQPGVVLDLVEPRVLVAG